MRWLYNKIKNKLKLLSLSNIKALFKEHGLALVIIVVGWEIVEDVVFPVIFGLLGRYVDPAFYAGIPISLVVCLHWLMVPVLWSLWIKISNKKKSKIAIDCCDNKIGQ